ncbi:MAG: DUF2382 domain-containing protein, partial [Chitinophagaceae bacterium]
VEALESKGFSSSNIDISNRSANDTSTSTTSHSDSDEHESGIERFFKNLFGDNDHDDRDKYSRVARESDCIVTVHAQSADEAERAADILDDNGAVNVDERASQYGYTGSGDTNRDTAYSNDTDTDTSYSSDSNYSDTNKNSGETIDVIKEDLEIGKREVETGGVRLRSRIVERPVEESVRLREERVNVTRNPVDREATEAEINAFEERDIEMIEKAEGGCNAPGLSPQNCQPGRYRLTESLYRCQTLYQNT